MCTKARVKFNGDCLTQDKISFGHGKIVNIYIVYEIERNIERSSYPSLENCLFGAVKLTKPVDIDLYKYSERYIDILKQLVLMTVIFYHENLKDCLMKVLSLLLRLIKCLILQ